MSDRLTLRLDRRGSGFVRKAFNRWRVRWEAAERHHPWVGGRIARVHLPMLLLFVLTRALLYAAGLRFNLDLGWMFLSEPAALRERLVETVYYFHAFAPGMNLLSGVLLKLVPDHMHSVAAALFWASGWLLFASLFQVLKRLGLPGVAALGVSLLFSLLPQSLYLENLYLYTHPCTSLLCLGAVLFERGLRRASARAWSCFFLVCAVLGWLYTTFHLVWFGIMVAGSLALAARGVRRRVLAGAALPGALLLALYLKNFAVFGVFGATSWGGANLTLATTQIMPYQLRSQWIREGKLSPYAAITVFAPPSDYLALLPRHLHFPWPGSNELWRPSLDSGNFNHGLFLQVNQQRRKDSIYFIRARPWAYLQTVLETNLPGLFSSTTHWHPSDALTISPHYQHRQVLGGYERTYDLLVHTYPVPGYGLYVFLPAFCLWALRHTWVGLRSRDPQRQRRAALLGFCLFQLTFVVSASCLFSSLESARYRYAVEPCIWAVVASGIHCAYCTLRRRLARSSAGKAAGPVPGPS